MPKCVRTGSEAVEYWDSSALIKLYAPEPDSLYYVRRAAEGTGPIITSLIAKTAVVIGLRRKEAIGDLNAGTAAILIRKFHSDCESGRIQIVPHDVAVAREAERLAAVVFGDRQKPVFIRSLDLIHAASASVVHAEVFVATDKRLREVVALLGVSLAPPSLGPGELF